MSDMAVLLRGASFVLLAVTVIFFVVEVVRSLVNRTRRDRNETAHQRLVGGVTSALSGHPTDQQRNALVEALVYLAEGRNSDAESVLKSAANIPLAHTQAATPSHTQAAE